MIKAIFAFTAALAALFFINLSTPAPAQAFVATGCSGTTGNCNWSVQDEGSNHTLTITCPSGEEVNNISGDTAEAICIVA